MQLGDCEHWVQLSGELRSITLGLRRGRNCESWRKSTGRRAQEDGIERGLQGSQPLGWDERGVGSKEQTEKENQEVTVPWRWSGSLELTR